MKNILYPLLLLLITLSASICNASAVNLPQTGQTVCYNSTGAEITCAGTGQDGDKKAGVAWPNPRFTVNKLVDNITEDGTVTDNLTGLVWLKNADCFGALSWQGALDSANALASGACGLTDGSQSGEWRLPNAVELGSLVDLGRSQPAIPQGNLFSVVPNVPYWMSSTDADFNNYAWTMDMYDGYITSSDKTGLIPHVLPVRDSKTTFSAIQLPQTGQKSCWDSYGNPLDCAGTGQDADKSKGVLWPVPRFTDNGNGTVTDSLSGLIWLKNAGCFAPQNWESALGSANSLASGICTLTDGSMSGDWRLPNRKELQSLVDYQKSFPALPDNNLFSGVQFSGNDPVYYWSSNSADIAKSEAWFVDMFDGYVDYNPKTDNQYVWPVRNPPNNVPVITDGDSVAVTVSKNGTPTAFSLTLHATDTDNDTLTWSVLNNASHGTASAGGSGSSLSVLYTPAADYVGPDSFTVQVSDGKGGLDSITVNVTVNQTYIVSTSVAGNGSINPGVSNTFNSGAITTYAVYAGTGSYISGVSGCGGTLSGNSYTTAAITGNCTVTADFKIIQVKVPGNSVRTDYNTLQEAYSNTATLSGMTIQARTNTFVESLNLNRPINVTIKGGYDPNFQVINGYITIQGSVSISSGSLTVDGITIR